MDKVQAKRTAAALRRAAALPTAEAQRQRQLEAALRRAAAAGLAAADEQLELDKTAVKRGTMAPDDFLVAHGEPVRGMPGHYWLTTMQRINGHDWPVRKVYVTRAAEEERLAAVARLYSLVTQISTGMTSGALAVSGIAGGRRVTNVQAGGGYGGR